MGAVSYTHLDVYKRQGIYRKTTLHNQKPFKETQMLIKSTNNGNSYQVSEFIVPPMDTTRENMRDDNEVLVTGDATWSTARILDIKYDKGLDALHVVFDTTHGRKHSKNVYHVLYNFYSDTFTAAGNGINPVSYTHLDVYKRQG